MATTPEGKIKTKVKQVLDKYRDHTYTYMPVPGGYGKATLDWLGAIRGVAFAIEAKAPGKKPTARQYLAIQEMVRGDVTVFVINDEAGLEALDNWLARMTACRTPVIELTSSASGARATRSKSPMAAILGSPTRA